MLHVETAGIPTLRKLAMACRIAADPAPPSIPGAIAGDEFLVPRMAE
jgi:hypothetical protein